MDTRAQIEGIEEVREACAALTELASIAKSLPAAFRRNPHTRPQDKARALVSLCKSEMPPQLDKMNEAYARVLAFPDVVELTYQWPKDAGEVSICEGSVRFNRGDLKSSFQKLNKVLATLCEDIGAYQQACKLADELETALESCPPTQYGKPPYVSLDGLRREYEDYLQKSHRQLSEAVEGIVKHAEWQARADGMFAPNGLLAHLKQAWAKVPPATEPVPKVTKSRSKQPIEDRVRAAMFGMYEDGEDFSSKAKVARRMGFKSASNLNKPKADEAFRETLKLLSKQPPKEPKTPARSKQTRLVGEKARREESHDN